MANKIISRLKIHPYNCFVPCLLIVLLTFIVYFQTVEFGLVDYDDPTYISNNPHLKEGFTQANFDWSVAFFLNSNWAPVTIWSYIADASLYGDWYGGYHLTNIILHGVNGLLLFFIGLRLSNNPGLSFILAVLFVVHPQHVESVAWISQRKDLLSALFMFLSLLLYVNYKNNDLRYFYLLSVGVFIFGLMAKVIIAPLPIILLLIDYVFFSSDIEKRDLRYYLTIFIEKIPYFIAALVVGGVNYFAQSISGALGTASSLPADIRISNIPVSYWFYPIKTIAPLNLIPFYPYPNEASLLLPLMALILLITVTIILYLTRDKYKYLFFGWFCYLILATPMSGLFQTGAHAYADRYSYIANIGLLIIIIAVLSKSSKFISSKAITAYVIVGALALTYLSYKQTALWKDTYTLFSHTLNVSPNNYVAQLRIAKELAIDNKKIEAERHIKRAIETNPLEAYVYSFAAKHYYINDKFEEAKKLLESALSLDVWRKGIVYRELAQYYILQGNYKAAIEFSTTAIEYKHEIASSYLVRGIAYRNNGNINEALSDLRKAISLNRQFTKAYITMGNTLMSIGHTNKALLYYEEALKQNPGNAKLKKIVDQLTAVE